MNKRTNNPEESDIRILEYIDGAMSAEDQQEFEQMLQDDPALKFRYETLSRMEGLFRREPPLTTSQRFTEKVMEQIDLRAAQFRFSFLNGLLILSAVVLVVAICTVMISKGVFDTATTTVDLNDINLYKTYLTISLPSFALQIKPLINLIIFLNLVVGLIVLDRFVLKPFFQKRINPY